MKWDGIINHFSTSLYRLSKPQILIESHALFKINRERFEQLNIENQTEFDQLQPELQTHV